MTARCGQCHRPVFLWGGENCDVCDSDLNGRTDRNEPTGIGPQPRTASLFQPEEKGYAIVSGATVERITRNYKERGFAVCSNVTQRSGMPFWAASTQGKQEHLHLRVLKMLQRRFRNLPPLTSALIYYNWT